MATAGVAGLLALTGCNSSPTPTPTPPTQLPSLGSSNTPLPFETAAPSASPQQAAVVAYRNMWHAFVEAAKTSNADDKNLPRYASGNALTLIVNSLAGNRDKARVTVGDVALDPQVVEFTPPQDPTEVGVVDCVDARNWLEYKAAGGLVDDEPGAKHRTTATITKTSEGWKVKAFTLLGGGTC